jgi:hypothetical protein
MLKRHLTIKLNNPFQSNYIENATVENACGNEPKMSCGNIALIPFFLQNFGIVFFFLLLNFAAVGKGAVQRRVRLGPIQESCRPTGSSEEGP